MTCDLHGRQFTLISNTAGEAKPGETVFVFEQVQDAVRVQYSGGGVVLGSIVGTFVKDDVLEVLFQQVTTAGALNSGKGRMLLEKRTNGRLYFVDDWSFLINAQGSGQAVWEEMERL